MPPDHRLEHYLVVDRVLGVQRGQSVGVRGIERSTQALTTSIGVRHNIP
jgi:hypothetical protein